MVRKSSRRFPVREIEGVEFGQPREAWRPSKPVEGAPSVRPLIAAEDRVLAKGVSPEGVMEMLIQLRDGTVVLLWPAQPQVRNRPIDPAKGHLGPRMAKTQYPDQFPLVGHTTPKRCTQAVRSALGLPPLRALLTFKAP